MLHHSLCNCPLLKSCSFPITCLILSLLDSPQSALQAKERIQSASTSGVFTISKDSKAFIPLLARTEPHILARMSSLLLKDGRDFPWNFATAPLTCKRCTCIKVTIRHNLLAYIEDFVKLKRLALKGTSNKYRRLHLSVNKWRRNVP